MINFRLDSEKKLIQVEMLLKGEAEPIKFQVGKYEIIKEDDKVYLEVKDLATNREWMNVAIGNFLKDGTKVEIPAQYERLLHIAM
jgi:hypothetical protein